MYTVYERTGLHIQRVHLIRNEKDRRFMAEGSILVKMVEKQEREATFGQTNAQDISDPALLVLIVVLV